MYTRTMNNYGSYWLGQYDNSNWAWVSQVSLRLALPSSLSTCKTFADSEFSFASLKIRSTKLLSSGSFITKHTYMRAVNTATPIGRVRVRYCDRFLRISARLLSLKFLALLFKKGNVSCVFSRDACWLKVLHHPDCKICRILLLQDTYTCIVGYGHVLIYCHTHPQNIYTCTCTQNYFTCISLQKIKKIVQSLSNLPECNTSS